MANQKENTVVTNMNYKKPTVVAKSDPKKSYVAGCPSTKRFDSCCPYNDQCKYSRGQ